MSKTFPVRVIEYLRNVSEKDFRTYTNAVTLNESNSLYVESLEDASTYYLAKLTNKGLFLYTELHSTLIHPSVYGLKLDRITNCFITLPEFFAKYKVSDKEGKQHVLDPVVENSYVTAYKHKDSLIVLHVDVLNRFTAGHIEYHLDLVKVLSDLPKYEEEVKLAHKLSGETKHILSRKIDAGTVSFTMDLDTRKCLPKRSNETETCLRWRRKHFKQAMRLDLPVLVTKPLPYTIHGEEWLD